MELAEFDYDLPERAIAQRPAEPRDAARLLVDRDPGDAAAVEHRTVADVPRLVAPGDVVVVNTTRVLPARLRLHKETGGEVEVLLLERLPGGAWEALVRPSRRVRPGAELVAGDDLTVRVDGDGPGDGTRLVSLDVAGGDELAALDRHGEVPLPPYITTPLDDPERYQTVFAERPGSVAAPTAGLHLTPAVLEACRAGGARVAPVELVVGMGTFRPMTTTKVEDHEMHAERYRVPASTLAACDDARAAGGRVVAIGTTTVRALESAALSGDLEGRTDLFISRPWRWRAVDVLMTNFHLPRSSLLVLVDAFVGPRWRDLYRTALAEGYRFLSFGDALWLERGSGRRPAGAGGDA